MTIERAVNTANQSHVAFRTGMQQPVAKPNRSGVLFIHSEDSRDQTDRREDFLSLLDRSDPRPAELLEQFDSRRIVESCRRMCPEEQTKTFPLRQRRRTRSV